MKHIILIFTALFMISANSYAEDVAPDSLFDGRGWHLDYSAQNANSWIFEFTLPGQTVENWKELVTVHVDTLDGTPEQFANAILQQIQQAGGQYFKSSVLEQSDNDILVEWSISGLPADKKDGYLEDQYELMRVYRDGDNLVRVRYTTRDLTQVDEMKPIWIEQLKEFKL